jgi:2-aminoadipate transaminase
MNESTNQTQMGFNIEESFSERIRSVPRSFIREILKVAISRDLISFAGGLPNEELFPVSDLKLSTQKLFEKFGTAALQYSNSEGFYPLREYIAGYYKKRHGLSISPEHILITSGSQQALDLLGKVLIDKGDQVIIESPGYLGAIQAFSVFQPRFKPVNLLSDGIDTGALANKLSPGKIKIIYTVPQFQNPSGISYSAEVRYAATELLSKYGTIIIEDNPYIDLRFEGEGSKSFYHYLPGQTILLGTFSKIAVPGFRLGWVVASGKLMEKLIIAKQASDLHTSIFTQMLLFCYLSDFDIGNHIGKIRTAYGKQRNAMVNALEMYMPEEVKFIRPQGGMFLWLKMPAGKSSMELFEKALAKNVAFVPGNPFYTTDLKDYPTLRLNFSCVGEKLIQEGIFRIAEAYKEL